MPTPYFNATELRDPSNEYVAWIDVMGVQSHMARSLSVTANFVYKLHISALEVRSPDLSLYPVMDGLYCTAQSEGVMRTFLKALLDTLGGVFVREANPLFRFMVRCGLARGLVHHGANLTRAASFVLDDNPQYRGSLFLGQPIVQSHLAESNAPPFGVSVHPSAEPAFSSPWWQWLSSPPARTQLLSALRAHFGWCYANAESLRYEPARARVHEGLAVLYFGP